MSYKLKVRYGTAVEPWHTLAPWYRAGTTAMGDGGGDYVTTAYMVLGATFVAGALTMHLMHKFRVLGMNRRPRRNRRR
jgi:hypothetical protein